MWRGVSWLGEIRGISCNRFGSGHRWGLDAFGIIWGFLDGWMDVWDGRIGLVWWRDDHSLQGTILERWIRLLFFFFHLSWIGRRRIFYWISSLPCFLFSPFRQLSSNNEHFTYSLTHLPSPPNPPQHTSSPTPASSLIQPSRRAYSPSNSTHSTRASALVRHVAAAILELGMPGSGLALSVSRPASWWRGDSWLFREVSFRGWGGLCCCAWGSCIFGWERREGYESQCGMMLIATRGMFYQGKIWARSDLAALMDPPC